MGKQLVPDELWQRIAPLIPADPSRPRGGRPRVPARNALAGIIFVLRTGIPWELLPQEMGCGSGMTCWRRLRDWNEAGVWPQLHQALLDELGRADRISWNRAALDSASVPRKKGGAEIGPNPTDRGKAGSNHHILVDASGVPLAVELTGANVHDSIPFERLLDKVPPIRRPRGRPRKRPSKLHADKAYDHRRCRQACRRRGIRARIARRGIESSQRLGRHRWVVERTLAWLHRFRRLVIRYKRRADIHRAFLMLAVALLCFRFVSRFC
nr:IS5 family transposase [Chondromyces crocatus]